jgi:hypothetical protein
VKFWMIIYAPIGVQWGDKATCEETYAVVVPRIIGVRSGCRVVGPNCRADGSLLRPASDGERSTAYASDHSFGTKEGCAVSTDFLVGRSGF